MFVNDQLARVRLTKLVAGGTRLLALRCAGFNNSDLDAMAAHIVNMTRAKNDSAHTCGNLVFARTYWNCEATPQYFLNLNF